MDVQPPAPAPGITAGAARLGRDAGKAAASWMFDGNTPDVLCTFQAVRPWSPSRKNTGGTLAAVTDGGSRGRHAKRK